MDFTTLAGIGGSIVSATVFLWKRMEYVVKQVYRDFRVELDECKEDREKLWAAREADRTQIINLLSERREPPTRKLTAEDRPRGA